MKRWHPDPIINALAEKAARGELESQQPASGTEARRATTENTGVVHDGPTAESGDAQKEGP